jgi:CheY-like chemotaxis protein
MDRVRGGRHPPTPAGGIDHEPPNEADGGESGGQAPTQRKVAIVEDDPDLSMIYLTFLERLGYRSVLVVGDGESLVRAVMEGEFSPDLILMDSRLPGMSGIEAAKKIVERKPTVKVVFTTADDSVREQADALGFLFLQKPFTLAALSGVLGHA